MSQYFFSNCFFLHSWSALELLGCTQHLLSWTLTNELLNEQFLVNLFDMANWKEVICSTCVSLIVVMKTVRLIDNFNLIKT